MLLIILTLAVPAILLPLYGAFKEGAGNERLSAYIAIASLLLALLESPFELFLGPKGIWYYPTHLLSFDMISFFFSVTIIIVSLMAAVGSITTMQSDRNASIYYSLILFTVIGMILVSSTTDLLFLLVSWELMTVPTFVLVALKKRDRLSSEAAMKYFLAAALSAALILFGLSLAYGLTNSTSFYSLIYAFEHSSQSQLPSCGLSACIRLCSQNGYSAFPFLAARCSPRYISADWSPSCSRFEEGWICSCTQDICCFVNNSTIHSIWPFVATCSRNSCCNNNHLGQPCCPNTKESVKDACIFKYSPGWIHNDRPCCARNCWGSTRHSGTASSRAIPWCDEGFSIHFYCKHG